jgi:hypothetical protein
MVPSSPPASTSTLRRHKSNTSDRSSFSDGTADTYHTTYSTDPSTSTVSNHSTSSGSGVTSGLTKQLSSMSKSMSKHNHMHHSASYACLSSLASSKVLPEERERAAVSVSNYKHDHANADRLVDLNLEETSLYLPNGTDKLYLPRKKSLKGLNRGYKSDCSLDLYLSGIPSISRRGNALRSTQQSSQSSLLSSRDRRQSSTMCTAVMDRGESIDETKEEYYGLCSSNINVEADDVDQDDDSGCFFIDFEDEEVPLNDTVDDTVTAGMNMNRSRSIPTINMSRSDSPPLCTTDEDEEDNIVINSIDNIDHNDIDNDRWLNVMQGEVAHATPSQADIMVSTDATTCHIVALRSTYNTSTINIVNNAEPLTSVTHVDKAAYEQSLEDMVTYHIQHHLGFESVPVALENEDVVCHDFWGHSNNSSMTRSRNVDILVVDDTDADVQSQERERSFLPLMHGGSIPSLDFSDVSNETNENETLPHQHQAPPAGGCSSSNTNKIQMELHLVGGFLDKDGTSVELSNHLIELFSALAKKFSQEIQMTIQTALISCMNTTQCQSNLCSNPESQVASPWGRGLGIDTRSGRVFLVNDLASHKQGPVPELRAARLMFGDCSEELQVIHESKNGEQSLIKIQPFDYQPFGAASTLLQLPDELLLQHTSTSPECESSTSFCRSLRKTLSFVQSTSSQDIFNGHNNGNNRKEPQPLVFQRQESVQSSSHGNDTDLPRSWSHLSSSGMPTSTSTSRTAGTTTTSSSSSSTSFQEWIPLRSI